MKFLLITLSIISMLSVAYSYDIKSLSVYSTSTQYYGKQMRVEFFYDEVKKTPVCDPYGDSFPITQTVALNKALLWAKTKFDPKKEWKPQEVSLKFLTLDSNHCVYVIQLKPGNDMQSLPIGVLMDGTVKAPVAKGTKGTK